MEAPCSEGEAEHSGRAGVYGLNESWMEDGLRLSQHDRQVPVT